MFLYLAYTDDDLELPVCVFDTCRELAMFLNCDYRYCALALRTRKKIKGYNVGIVYVE